MSETLFIKAEAWYGGIPVNNLVRLEDRGAIVNEVAVALLPR